MEDRKAGFAVFMVIACWPLSAAAQVPGLPSAPTGLSPGVPGLGVGAPGVPAAAPAAAAPKTLWSSLGLSSANIHACQAKICASQFGQMLNSFAGGPVGGLTGGFIPPLCPPAPNASQIAALQQQPGGAAAAAAQIKASEANAKRGSPPSSTWGRSTARGGPRPRKP